MWVSDVAPAERSWAFPNFTTSVPPEKPLPLMSTNVRSFEEPNIGLKEVIFWPISRLVPARKRSRETKNLELKLICVSWVHNRLNLWAPTQALPAVCRLTHINTHK